MIKIEEKSIKSLFWSVNQKEIEKSYEKVHAKIDEMLSGHSIKEKREALKIMIAYCEGKMNNTCNMGISAIAYTCVVSAVVMTGVSLKAIVDIVLFLLALAFTLLMCANGFKTEEFRVGYVHKILCCELEELCIEEKGEKNKNKEM